MAASQGFVENSVVFPFLFLKKAEQFLEQLMMRFRHLMSIDGPAFLFQSKSPEVAAERRAGHALDIGVLRGSFLPQNLLCHEENGSKNRESNFRSGIALVGFERCMYLLNRRQIFSLSKSYRKEGGFAERISRGGGSSPIFIFAPRFSLPCALQGFLLRLCHGADWNSLANATMLFSFSSARSRGRNSRLAEGVNIKRSCP